VRKDRIKIDCAACGHNSLLGTTHRLAQYILKNPPAKKPEKGEKIEKPTAAKGGRSKVSAKGGKKK